MEIGKTFCGRTDGRTHLSSNLLGHRRGDDLKTENRVTVDCVCGRVSAAGPSGTLPLCTSATQVQRTAASDAATDATETTDAGRRSTHGQSATADGHKRQVRQDVLVRHL